MKKLLFGLIGGLSLGLLFAPKKGKDLRNDLLKSDEKIQDFAKEVVNVGKEASDEVMKFLKSKPCQTILEKGKAHLDELLEEGESLSKKGKEELEKVVKTVKEKKQTVSEDVKDFFKK
ncbi:MAG: YtxH domain-containing protein [Candidatus Peregrinibacteria bacterium]